MYGSVYIDDALTDHSLNDGLVERWMALPGQQRGVFSRGLRRQYDGTLVNNPLRSGIQKNGGYGSLDFTESSSQYVNCGDVVAMNSATQMTLTAWIKKKASNSLVYIIKSVPANNANYLVGLEWYIDQVMYVTCGSGSAYSYGATSAISSTEWVHFAMVFNGSGSGNTGRLQAYLNGAPLTLGSFSGTIPTALADNSGGIFNIGRIIFNTSSTNYSSAYIDDVCVFDRALSATLVKQLYQEQLRGSPETLKWYKRKAYSFVDAGGGGNRRRRVICGAA